MHMGTILHLTRLQQIVQESSLDNEKTQRHVAVKSNAIKKPKANELI